MGKAFARRYNRCMTIPLLDSLFKLVTTLINSVWGRKERRIKAAAAFRETFLKELLSTATFLDGDSASGGQVS